MDIDPTTKSDSLDKSISEVSSQKSYSSEAGSSESSSFAELLSEKALQKTSADKKTAEAKNKNDNAQKELEESANNDKILLNLKNIKDINMLLHTRDLSKQHKIRFKIDIDSLTDGDAKFVKELLNNPNVLITSFNQRTSEVTVSMEGKEVAASYKSYNISKTLTNLIEYAYNSQKPVRLDFSNNSSVILKINEEGKLAAQFISSDKAMESLLKSSIPGLRNKLDAEGIPYKEISYRERNKKEQERK